MRNRAKRFVAHGVLPFLVFGNAYPQGKGRKLVVTRDNLCVTEGAIEKAPSGRLSINVPKMRAYVSTWTAQDVEVRFIYLGPTTRESRLGSGQVRRQFGLKLRAQDPCNLVYAMWRIEPESKLVVSVKRNRGQHTSAECGNRGYQNIKPQRFTAVPLLRGGDSHTLRAEMRRENLRVFADDSVVWDGNVGSDAAGLEGPVGMRSDNARLELDFKVGEYVGVHPSYQIACKSGTEASE